MGITILIHFLVQASHCVSIPGLMSDIGNAAFHHLNHDICAWLFFEVPPLHVYRQLSVQPVEPLYTHSRSVPPCPATMMSRKWLASLSNSARPASLTALLNSSFSQMNIFGAFYLLLASINSVLDKNRDYQKKGSRPNMTCGFV